MTTQTRVRQRTVNAVRTLPCKLTEGETRDAASEAARVRYAIEQKEQEKKSIGERIKSEMATLTDSLKSESEKVRTGIEYRQVDCEVAYDYDLSMVSVVRTDTGEVVESRAMRSDEKQMKLGV